MAKVLILRPRPGAEETAARATAAGLEPVIAPLFLVSAVGWEPPAPAQYSAVMLTSAQAARLAGPALGLFTHLPCYTVGEATAGAAAEAGFARVIAGDDDSAALLGRIARDGADRILHLCGREHIAAAHPGVTIERRVVYAADAVDRLPEAAGKALAEGAVALLHSARAAALFGDKVRARGSVRIAALSRAVAQAAGAGWHKVAIAPAPRDEALLELAAKLCENERLMGDEA